MASIAPIPTLVLDDTMGAALIGVLVAAVLYGVSAVQTYTYYTEYENDLWYMKTLVGAVFLFDTVHQILISHTVYTYIVTNFNNPAILGQLVWSLIVEVLFSGLIALLVQLFLVWRVWRLSKGSVWMTVSCLSLVFAEFGCVVVYFSRGIMFTTFAQLATLKGLSIAVNVLAAAGDALITAQLIFLLKASKTGFQNTERIIARLMKFTINTGAATTACAIASLISITAAPNTFIYICFFFCLGRLYSNSLLATLNARKTIRGVVENMDSGVSVSLQEIPSQHISSAQKLQRQNGNGKIAIKIDTTKEYAGDKKEDFGSQSDREMDFDTYKVSDGNAV